MIFYNYILNLNIFLQKKYLCTYFERRQTFHTQDLKQEKPEFTAVFLCNKAKSNRKAKEVDTYYLKTFCFLHFSYMINI